jgi:hypothetical protein
MFSPLAKGNGSWDGDFENEVFKKLFNVKYSDCKGDKVEILYSNLVSCFMFISQILGRTACFYLEHVLCVFKSCGLEINYTDRSLK